MVHTSNETEKTIRIALGPSSQCGERGRPRVHHRLRPRSIRAEGVWQGAQGSPLSLVKEAWVKQLWAKVKGSEVGAAIMDDLNDLVVANRGGHR